MYPCINDRAKDQDQIAYMDSQGAFAGLDIQAATRNIGFHEFTLEELGLPSAKQLLAAARAVEHEVGLQGWVVNGEESKLYRGYSLTYNDHYAYRGVSLFHQTFGAEKLTQVYGRAVNTGLHDQIRDTYYDTYQFRVLPLLVREHFAPLLSRLSMPLLRSRVAYRYAYGCDETSFRTNHVDEFPYQLLRINIPLLTTPEQAILIEGQDEYGNELNVPATHLEVGKAYIWNTRVPHRNLLTGLCTSGAPRIHLVLGVAPWFDYDEQADAFVKGKHHGVPLETIIRERLFVR